MHGGLRGCACRPHVTERQAAKPDEAPGGALAREDPERCHHGIAQNVHAQRPEGQLQSRHSAVEHCLVAVKIRGYCMTKHNVLLCTTPDAGHPSLGYRVTLSSPAGRPPAIDPAYSVVTAL